MSRVVAIIQARMGSTRFPGKVLEDIGGQTMLRRVVARTARAERVDEVVVATSVAVADDTVAIEAALAGAQVWRGSEHDVLHRYWGAARAFKADTIVRATGDCPLIDPEFIDSAVTFLRTRDADYVYHDMEHDIEGTNAEVFTYDTLNQAQHEARADSNREHVTQYIYEHPAAFKVFPIPWLRTKRRGWRWCVDTPADLEFARGVYAHFGNVDTFGWRDVCAYQESLAAA